MKFLAKISASLAIPVLFFSITFILFLIVSIIFKNQFILCIGIPFSFSAFFLGYNLFSENPKNFQFEFNKKLFSIFLYVLTILSSLIVLFIPNSNAAMLEWTQVSSINWLRYIATILLTLFLPGYYLSSIISRNARSFFGTLTFSWLLSFLISFIIGFIQLILFNSITSLSIYLVIVINLLLMSFYLLISKQNEPIIKISTSFLEIGSILSIIAIIMIGNIYVMNSTLPFSYGDMRTHLSLALQYSEGFPLDNGILTPYPIMFHISLATIFQTSGIPAPIAYQSLFALNFIPIISLFALLSSWLTEKKSRIFGYILAPLLGFGSLYAFYLKTVNPTMSLLADLNASISKTYDISNLMTIIPSLSNLVPVLLIELPALFLFLVLLRKNSRSPTRPILFSLIIFVAYLSHISGAFFMAVLLLLYLIFTRDTSVKDASIGGLISLLLVLLIDVSVYPRSGSYILGNGQILFENQLTYVITFALFSFSFLISKLIEKQFKTPPLFQKISVTFQKLFTPLRYTIFFTYLFSLIVWFWVSPNYNAYTYGGYNHTPFFVWPLRFGALGLLFVLLFSFFNKKLQNNKNILFLTAVVTVGFILEQLSNILQIYPSYRLATFTWIGLLIMTAFLLSKIMFTSKLKKYFFSFALLLIIIPGMFSLCFSYYYRGSVINEVTSAESDALSYIKQNLSDNSSILTFTEDSANKLTAFAAINTLQVIQRWSDIILKTTDLSAIINLLVETNTQYIYLDSLDQAQLNSSQGIFTYFLQNCPVAFSNTDVTIYAVPVLSSSSENPQIIVLSFLNLTSSGCVQLSNTTSYNLLLSAIPSLSQSKYQIMSLPLFNDKEYNLTVIDDCGSLLNWSVSEGSSSIKIDATDYITSTSSILATNTTTDKNGYFAIKRDLSIDLQNNGYLTFWVKVPEGISKWLKVILRNDAETYRVWVFSGFRTNEWIKISVPLDNPYTESTQSLNLSSVKSIEIGFTSDSNQSLSDFKVDELSYGNITEKSTFDLPSLKKYANVTTIFLQSDLNFDASPLLELVKNGINLVVLGNFSESGYVFNLLNLTCTGYTISNKIDYSSTELPSNLIPIIDTTTDDTRFLINYTYLSKYVSPFVIQKSIDNGNIYFMNVAPLSSLNASDCLSIINKTFSSLNSTLKLERYEQITTDLLPTYLNRVVEANISASGLIKINSECSINRNPIFSYKINISTNQEEYVFTNVTITNLRLFNSSIVGENAKMLISPNISSSFVEVSIENGVRSDFSIIADKCSIEIQESGEEINLMLENVTLNCNFSDFKLFSQISDVEINGSTTFAAATIAERPYIPLAGSLGQTIEVNGITNFSINSASRNLIMLSNFNYEGSVNLIDNNYVLSLDWFSFLNSIFFVIIILLTIVGVVIIIFKKNLIKIEAKKK